METGKMPYKEEQLKNMNTFGVEAARPMTTEEMLEKLFTYHPPREDQIPKYTTVRDAAKYFAEVIIHNVPSGSDQSAAIRLLRECVMTANAGIALDGFTPRF